MKLLYIGCMASAGTDNGFTKAMRNVCDEYEEIPVSQPNLNERICQVTSADLVFIQIQATGIREESIQWLKSLGAYIINWSGDCRQPLPEIYVQMAQWGCDLTCFSNMEDVRHMRELGYASEFLQIGYDPEIYYPGQGAEAPEIVFMGNNCGGFPLSTYRQQMVAFLKATYGNRFGVYGSGWVNGTGNFMGDQQGEANLYRGAKIGINLSHFDCERYTSDRLFRMLGTGICVLTHNFFGAKKDFPGIGRWNNFTELQELIDWYLQNESLRKSAANYGQLLAITEYTFLDMAKNIISLWQK